MGIGMRLKQILDEKEITLKDLSLMSGVSLNTLYGITKRDNETIKNDILVQIAGSLNVPPQYILGFDDYAPQWSDEEIDLFEDDFVDTKDGLLNEILKISRTLTTAGRIKCIDYLKSIQNDNLDDEYKLDEQRYKKWDEIRLNELTKMYNEGLIPDLDFQKLNLMVSKRIYIPFIEPDDEFDKEATKLRNYVKEAEQRLAPEIQNGNIKNPFDD